MDDGDTLAGSLGLSKQGVSEKCAAFTIFFVERRMKGESTPEALIGYIKDNLTEEERIYLSLMFLAEKAQMLLDLRDALDDDEEMHRPRNNGH